jgi:ubiquinol-cytochrome c reductase cytochrome b subunit
MSMLRNGGEWLDDRTGIVEIVKPMATHLVPREAKWWYVFGSATLFSLIIQVITGITLATMYVPSTSEAYASLQYITTRAAFGSLVRGMHYFGASAMILFVGVHMIRVFLMAAYKYPREMNWLSGVALLGLTVGMGFTGQLLRWDQNAVWSTVVGAEQAARLPILGKWMVRVILSGSDIGSLTLSHFFVLHVFVIPVLLAAVLGFHLHLVLRNGVSEPPVDGRPVDPQTYRAWYRSMLERNGHPFWTHAAWRDVAFGAAVVVGIVLLAFAFGAPKLDRPPNPAIVEAQPRPDWYLLWYFAVLALLPHRAESYVIVLAPLLGVLMLLAVPFVSNRGERSLRRRPWALIIVIFIVTCIGTLWRAGVGARWSPSFNATPLTEGIIGATSGPIYEGGVVFNTKGCLFCHTIFRHGGTRGPNLTAVGDRLTQKEMIIRIMNGGYDMPGYSNNITPEQLDVLVTFLQSRKSP